MFMRKAPLDMPEIGRRGRSALWPREGEGRRFLGQWRCASAVGLGASRSGGGGQGKRLGTFELQDESPALLSVRYIHALRIGEAVGGLE
jgi:hypothetical protein